MNNLHFFDLFVDRTKRFVILTTDIDIVIKKKKKKKKNFVTKTSPILLQWFVAHTINFASSNWHVFIGNIQRKHDSLYSTILSSINIINDLIYKIS